MPGAVRRVVGAILVLACVFGVGTVALAPYSWRLNRLTVWLYDFFRTDVPIAPAGATPEDYGNLLNFVLFIPVGLLLAWWLGSRWGWALPLAVGLSVSIELVQRLPELARQSSLGDIACNVMGACLGVVLVALVRAGWQPPPPRAELVARAQASGTTGRQ